MYHQFKIHKFHVLPTQCIYVICVDLRTNSNYFTDWFLKERWGVYGFDLKHNPD